MIGNEEEAYRPRRQSLTCRGAATVDLEASIAVVPDRWLLLIHQLPAKPAYRRVKVWRRLQALGAVAIKNAVYALPSSEQSQEDFEWLVKEIVEAGGDALICEARLVDGLSDGDVRALFEAARDADYAVIAEEARALTTTLSGTVSTDPHGGEGSARAPQGSSCPDRRVGFLRCRRA